MRILDFVVVCSVGVACAPGNAVRQPSEAELRQMIAEKWQSYEAAHKAQDPKRLANFFTEDARLRGPDPGWHSLQGRDTVEVLLSQSMPLTTVHDITFIIEDVISLGPHAMESGLWSEDFTVAGSQDTLRLTGGYTVLWARQSDDDWKIKAMTWNAHASSVELAMRKRSP